MSHVSYFLLNEPISNPCTYACDSMYDGYGSIIFFRIELFILDLEQGFPFSEAVLQCESSL